MQQERQGDTLILSGIIDNRTVNRTTYRTFEQHIASGVRHIVFTDVPRADSACVALLISAKRIVQETPLSISNTPDEVRDLLNLYRLNEWITLS